MLVNPQLHIISFFVGLILGSVVGFAMGRKYYKNMKAKNDVQNFDMMTLFIGYLVAIIWGVSMVTKIFIHDFQVDISLQTAIGAVVGSLFGKTIFKKIKELANSGKTNKEIN